MNETTTIVVFGITGDLAQKKLIPALLDLYIAGYLPKTFRIVGVGRKEMTEDGFRAYLVEHIEKRGHHHSKERAERFIANTRYLSGDSSQSAIYAELSTYLAKQDKELGTCSNKLFYLAVPPSLYEPIFDNLANAGLSLPCAGKRGWVRVAVEKPFGDNAETAMALDRKLALLFKEEQIFRIDHYLAKETLENILTFRFANVLFEPAWNNKHIEKVHIELLESGTVGKRGIFYEGVGALRDVGQNHLLQMLAFIAMEDPKEWSADAIRKARAEALEHLTLSDKDGEFEGIEGQYEGYLQEEGVNPLSVVETYFRFDAFVETPRWHGVPFILESGKAMEEDRVSITVYFKTQESCVCSGKEGGDAFQNKIVFDIQPDAKISLHLFAKKPGFDMDIQKRIFSFAYAENTEMKLKDAYERLLYDCLRGDQISFLSSREVECAWRFIMPLLDAWQEMEPHVYKTGTRPE